MKDIPGTILFVSNIIKRGDIEDPGTVLVKTNNHSIKNLWFGTPVILISFKKLSYTKNMFELIILYKKEKYSVHLTNKKCNKFFATTNQWKNNYMHKFEEFKQKNLLQVNEDNVITIVR